MASVPNKIGTPMVSTIFVAPPWWWLSFCDPALPLGQQFLGACIVPGFSLAEAIQVAWTMGCNPGGEVAGQEVPTTVERHIDPAWRARLLTRAECERFDREMKGNGVS